MSDIIQTVSYDGESSKALLEKLMSLIGTQKIEVKISTGELITGIVSEIGKDYLGLIENKFDVMIPIKEIVMVRFER